MSESEATHGRDAHGEPAIMQRDHELARIVAEGSRADDGTTCSVVLVRRTGGVWAFYPHGWGTFGVRLPDAEARRLAQAILDGGR